MPSLYDVIAERIKILREESGLSQYQLADILNCTQPKISKLETSGLGLVIEDLIQLAKIFNTTSDYILGLSNIRSKHRGP